MENLSKYLNEGLIKKQGGFQDKEGLRAKIEDWIQKNVKWDSVWKEYVINDDLTIDVWGDVEIMTMENLPEYIQFGVAHDEFAIGGEYFGEKISKLDSLEGCPRQCDSFTCRSSSIKNLKGCPEVKTYLYLTDNPKLTSLVGAPKECFTFSCYSSSIKNLKGCPKVRGDLNVSKNPNLESLEGAPNFARHFDCSDCPKLTSLKGGPSQVDLGYLCNRCHGLTSCEGLPKKLFTLCAYETKQEFIDDVRKNYGYNRLKEFDRSVYKG